MELLAHTRSSETLPFTLKPVPGSQSKEKAKRSVGLMPSRRGHARQDRLEWPRRNTLISEGMSYKSIILAQTEVSY